MITSDRIFLFLMIPVHIKDGAALGDMEQGG
jgi:hypothetical protein